MSSNSLSFTNVKDGIFNNLYLINDNGGLDDVKNLLSTSATSTNPKFTGNVGINLTVSDPNDSALYVRGLRNDNPQTDGIRLGSSRNTFGSGQSYGIELCSSSGIGSTIDFTYPDTNSFWAGRILFDNSQSDFRFYVRTTPATSELVDAIEQMLLNSNGELHSN